MAPTGDAYEVDWVLSTSSNFHIANHRDWFVNYAPIETFFEHAYACSTKFNALGLGDVKLEVRTDKTAEAYRTLTLNNVLYCPTSSVNIIGEPIFDKFPQWSTHDLRSDGGEVGMIFDNIRRTSGEPVRQKVWLKGHRRGYSSQDANTVGLTSAVWSQEAVLGCKVELQGRSQATSGRERSSSQSKPEDQDQRYTQVEQNWLKEHYESEYLFLRAHMLSIYKQEDRDEGRDLVRVMMERDPASHVCKRRRVSGDC
ncbi:hypothetical protein DOTSEDRAFT_81868 [Dothistroma septosporum NZE10]|uniref:Retrovirus-related Pol polyprotein from transposon TNT 1-94-like beta-barrel domain-containing protein n=1 Tax=Dothistroma septosporum (strain NZE10 / CBS 128990) TaxID=675120 RepID=N1PJ81_DOTSN|nr:hypothetical protein DOTSEDRAFT_81868 [Dothistroma septosporum NZE10]